MLRIGALLDTCAGMVNRRGPLMRVVIIAAAAVGTIVGVAGCVSAPGNLVSLTFACPLNAPEAGATCAADITIGTAYWCTYDVYDSNNPPLYQCRSGAWMASSVSALCPLAQPSPDTACTSTLVENGATQGALGPLDCWYSAACLNGHDPSPHILTDAVCGDAGVWSVTTGGCT